MADAALFNLSVFLTQGLLDLDALFWIVEKLFPMN